MGEKRTAGSAERRDPGSWRKNRERKRAAHRGMHKKNPYPKPLSMKTKEAEYPEFLQLAQLKD